jgi:formylglycine-generating enzyme required for sulfatase activity
MALKLGVNTLNKFAIGNSLVSKIYFGNDQVYAPTTTTTTTTAAPTTPSNYVYKLLNLNYIQSINSSIYNLDYDTNDSQAAVAAGANSANYNNDADWNGQDGNVTTVGTNGGPSAYGTFDQSGNVLEWNDLTGAAGSSRGLRGGRWNGDNPSALSSSNSFSYAPSNEDYNFGFRLASSSNPLFLAHFVTVGNAGNPNDITGYGGVNYQYQIGKYCVTNSDYEDFLDAVAATDSYGLYSVNMGSNARGGIARSGSSGSYTYSTRANMCAKPVNFVSWFDAARYCNWLHNNYGSTETGAYTLNGANDGNAVAKNPGALYWIPTENEWYKAAYHKSGGTNTGYWLYATQSNATPTAVAADATGNGPVVTAYVCV